MNNIKLEYHQEIDGKVVKKELEFSKDLIKIPYNIKVNITGAFVRENESTFFIDIVKMRNKNRLYHQ